MRCVKDRYLEWVEELVSMIRETYHDYPLFVICVGGLQGKMRQPVRAKVHDNMAYFITSNCTDHLAV